MSIFGKINERMNESVSVRSYATVSFKNKSLSRIMCEGAAEIDNMKTDVSEDKVKMDLNTTEIGVESPESIGELEEYENKLQNGEQPTPVSESAMAIRESVSGFFSNVWEKIKQFFAKVKKWVVELYGKILFMLRSIFASNKSLVDKYGKSVNRDYDDVEIDAIQIDLNKLMSVKPENGESIVSKIEDKFRGAIDQIRKYAAEMKAAAEVQGSVRDSKVVSDDSKDNVRKAYDEQRDLVDSDEFKDEIMKTFNNDDDYATTEVFNVMGGGGFSSGSITDLVKEFKDNIKETDTPTKLTSRDVGGYSKIKERMTGGDKVISKVEGLQSKIQKGLEKIQKDIEKIFTSNLRSIEKSEAKSSISSAFTVGIDFIGDSIKAVNAFIKAWVELYKHQLGIDRALFIRLYKKATGKKPQNNSVVDPEVESSLEGIETGDVEYFEEIEDSESVEA